MYQSDDKQTLRWVVV